MGATGVPPTWPRPVLNRTRWQPQADLVQKAGRVAAEEEGGLGLVVRNDVQQPEAGVLRPLRDLQNALDLTAAHFHDGAHALFLDRRQATDEVAR